MAGLEYINQIVLSPDFAQDRRVYLVAVQQIWESHDGGDTWAKEPYWDFTHQVRMLAASPALAAGSCAGRSGQRHLSFH